MTTPTIRETVDFISGAMDTRPNWSRLSVRKHFQRLYVNAEIDVDLATLEVRVEVTMMVRQQTFSDATSAVEFAAMTTEAAALALVLQNTVGAHRWTYDELEACLNELRAEKEREEHS
jgi:hypothetical protein